MRVIKISPAQLNRLIRDAIKAELSNFSRKVYSAKEKILTRKEAARKLGIDLSTLWRKREIIKPHKRESDGTIYYLESECDQYLGHKG